ncbi:MAG: BTAD domain-containing putative transcriptional regulator [Actinoplanes sp.]
MRITTLGALAVDGQPVRGGRLAAVIRELVDARGRPVSTAALVNAVWQGDPPDDSAGAVQALISRVRRLGVPVDAVPGGYRVPADRVEVDAVAVRGLVDQGLAALRCGDAEGARSLGDQARALFPEIPELEAAEVARLFFAVTSLRADAALAGAGGFEEADLRRLAARTPPDEPAAALLVRVLAAQGRDAEALEVVEQLRGELADRYGTDPSPVIAEVHLALLRGELVGAPRRRPAALSLPAAWRRSVTALVGREDDVAAVTEALASGPLVTVVATGGAGKTRLAAEIARRAAAEGRPVRVIELAGLRSGDEVLPAVLATFGGVDTAPTGIALERRVLSPVERLRGIAPDIEGLIVLDNCEHVLDAAATVVADLLAEVGPEVSVLATSRAPLGLVGERVHRLSALPDSEALGLLETRARAGGAVPTWDEERALELCHRLDNLPLALELAAARLRNMPIDDVLAGLSDRFALLDDALRGLPERHASLWAMVDWSRELLTPGDRELLQRAAVIPGPFPAGLAAAVSGTPQVRRGLANLVEQSLLSLDEGDGVPRYRMLETVREYGEARLDAADQRVPAMAGLVAWSRELAVDLLGRYSGSEQLTALGRCAADQEILLGGLRWAMAQDDEPAAVDIATAVFQLWTVRGAHLEVTAWAGGLVRVDDPPARPRSAVLAGRASGRPLPDADRLAWMLLLIGVNSGITGPLRMTVLARRGLRKLLAERSGEVSSRHRTLAESLPAFEPLDPEAGLAQAATMIAHPDPYVQGLGYFLRVAMLENSGDDSDRAGDAERAYRSFEAAGDHWGMAMAAQGVGHTVESREAAREWLARSVRHMELVGAVQDARSIRVLLDVQLALAGDRDAAFRLRETTEAGPGNEMDAAQAFLGLAHLAWQRGDYEEALRLGDAVTRLESGAGNRMPEPQFMFRIAVAVLYLRAARHLPALAAEAEAHAANLLTVTRAEVLASRDSPFIGAWSLGGAELAASRGDLEKARELWALGTRTGANVGRLLPPGDGELLATALGDEVQRKQLLSASRGPIATVNARVRELMDDLL